MFDNNIETRVYIEHGLVCPNPRKYYEMTRIISKKDDLRFANEVTDLDVIMLASILSQTSTPILWPFVIIFLFELGILGLMLNNLS